MARNPQDMLLEELADARERIKTLEAQGEEQRARSATPEQREAALREAEGQALLEAIRETNSKNSSVMRID